MPSLSIEATVIENKMRRRWAGLSLPDHFGWTIEAAEAEFDAVLWIGIECPHPLHEFSIRVEAAKARG